MPGTGHLTPTPPILQEATQGPQTPGTGHKKLKIRHLPMDKFNPPPPLQLWDPDLLAHPPGITPMASIPKDMV